MDAGINAEVLRSKLVAPHGPYAALDVVGRTASTNADLVLAADSGALDRTVLIAETQTAGRGRRERTWVSPPGAGLYLSVLLATGEDVAFTRLGTLSLLAGVAVARTAERAGVRATLKWPNDVLAGDAKLAGILSEVSQNRAVVVGIGLNVTELPESVPPGAGGLRPTSLAEQGASIT